LALIAVTGALIFQFSGNAAETSEGKSHETTNVPVKGMPTMVDLGAHKCIPCKMMAPVLEKAKKKYKERASIIFIDVWEDKAPGERFGIRAIPTQIFFDKEGREVFRHEGFMGEADIDRIFDRMGVN